MFECCYDKQVVPQWKFSGEFLGSEIISNLFNDWKYGYDNMILAHVWTFGYDMYKCN